MEGRSKKNGLTPRQEKFVLASAGAVGVLAFAAAYPLSVVGLVAAGAVPLLGKAIVANVALSLAMGVGLTAMSKFGNSLEAAITEADTGHDSANVSSGLGGSVSFRREGDGDRQSHSEAATRPPTPRLHQFTR